MKNPKCRYCKEEILGNPGFFLNIMRMWGYEELDFHNKECFLEWIKKKYKLEKW